ncbi:MAG: dihydrolipoyl dehydrogenase [Candidatus Gastranaerophilales bacterium]|nr:dihydrolipoyl dehydrogenase [Candidatus Gastranaerophilales bacterium]
MFDVGIIGAGPAGYTAAIRAAQYGLKVILFEKNQIGGTCLNRGCIPTKTILHSVSIYNEIKNSTKFGINTDNVTPDFTKIWERQKTVSEKIRKSLTNLIKSYGITIIEELAEIETPNIIKAGNTNYNVENIIIASGSMPNKLKFSGDYKEDFVLTSDEILNLTEQPKSILIAGSGAIGIEWARILSALQTKVYITEIADKLCPAMDYEVSERISRLFKKNRIEFYTSCSVEKIQNKTVILTNGKQIETDYILTAAGRIADIDFGKISEKLKINKYISTDCNFKTNIENIYAIGDINGTSMLAHSAMKQAENVIEYIIKGNCPKFDKKQVPSVIYGSPEIAAIGKTEQELIQENIKYKKSLFPVSALGKAYADDKIEGFIKILATEEEILGAHIISEEAGALIGQIAIMITNGIKPKEMHNTIFPHPTYSEGVIESILALDNMAIHIPQF